MCSGTQRLLFVLQMKTMGDAAPGLATAHHLRPTVLDPKHGTYQNYSAGGSHRTPFLSVSRNPCQLTGWRKAPTARWRLARTRTSVLRSPPQAGSYGYADTVTFQPTAPPSCIRPSRVKTMCDNYNHSCNSHSLWSVSSRVARQKKRQQIQRVRPFACTAPVQRMIKCVA